MPVVPFTPTPPRRDAPPREFTAAQAPWVLMAAAAMHSQGQLTRVAKDVPAEEDTNGRD